MIPLIIGAAVAGGIVYARRHDKNPKPLREETFTRELDEDDLPQWVREKFQLPEPARRATDRESDSYSA